MKTTTSFKKTVIRLIALYFITFMSVQNVSAYYFHQIVVNGVVYYVNEDHSTGTFMSDIESEYKPKSDIVIPSAVSGWMSDGDRDVYVTITVTGVYSPGFHCVYDPELSKSATEAVKTISVPSTVKKIALGGFPNLHTVTLTEGLEEINGIGFAECISLKSIDIPNTVKNIGERAFNNCKVLESISMPIGITLANRVFRNCSTLKTVNWKGDLTSSIKTILYDFVFEGCTSLTTLTMPGGYTPSGDLIGAPNLKELTILEGFETFTHNIVQGYPALETINLPASLKTVKNPAFRGCTGLKYVNFAENSKLETIESNAFENSGILAIDLPSNVSTIGENAFTNCKELLTVSLPIGILINKRAFLNCTKLKTINWEGISLSEIITDIEFEAFLGCSSLTTLSLPVVTNKYAAFTALKELTLLEGTTDLYENVIKGSRFVLEKINLPESLKNIEDYSFRECKNLIQLNFNTDAIHWEIIGNYAFLDCKILPSTLILPDVKKVGMNAFKNCTSLENISLPVGVTMGGESFYNCSNLKSIIFLGDLTSSIETDLGIYPFGNCSSLTFLNLPGRIKTNYLAAPALKEIIFNEGFESIDSYLLSYSTSTLEKVFLPASLKTIKNYAFEGYTKLKLVKFAKNSQLETIGDGAFFNFKGVFEDISFSAVKTIGISAFNGCTGLPERISFSSTLETINSQAFLKTKNLKYITFNSNSIIESNAFYLSENLESVTFNKALTIKGYAFARCGNLKSVYFNEIKNGAMLKSDNLDSLHINIGAFSDNPLLEKVEFSHNYQNGVTFDDYTFSSCPKFSTFIFPQNTSTVGRYVFNDKNLKYKVTFLGDVPRNFDEGAFCFESYGSLVQTKVTIYYYSGAVGFTPGIWQPKGNIKYNTVELEIPTLTSIELSAFPHKTEYFRGEALDLLGLDVIAKFDDGNSVSVNNYTTTPENGSVLTVEGEQGIIVSYTENNITKTATFNIQVSQSTKLDNTQNETLRIYPNPVNNILHIDGVEEVLKISIIDIYGRMIVEYTGNNSIIDVSILPQNMYIVSIQTSKGFIINKLIKKSH